MKSLIIICIGWQFSTGWCRSSHHPSIVLGRTGDAPMLETPQERMKLLKAGIDGKTIERLYIVFNNLKIVHTPLLFELFTEENKNSAIIEAK